MAYVVPAGAIALPGIAVLASDALFAVLREPDGSGMAAGAMAQARWNQMLPVTSAYSALPESLRGHPDWPAAGKKDPMRVMIIWKTEVTAMRVSGSRILLSTAKGPVELAMDRASRHISLRRFAELGWDLGTPE